MKGCPGFELIAIQDATALGDDLLKIGKGRETQMIRHMRHGSPPRLMALQSILSPNRRESLPTPSAGVRIIRGIADHDGVLHGDRSEVRHGSLENVGVGLRVLRFIGSRGDIS